MEHLIDICARASEESLMNAAVRRTLMQTAATRGDLELLKLINQHRLHTDHALDLVAESQEITVEFLEYLLFVIGYNIKIDYIRRKAQEASNTRLTNLAKRNSLYFFVPEA